MKFTSLFRPLLIVALSVIVLACKKKSEDPAPANVITAGNTSHKISRAYHQGGDKGFHALAFTSESLELKDAHYTGSGKLLIVSVKTEKEAATGAITLPEGTYSAEEVGFAFFGDIVDGDVVSDNTVELKDSELKVTKSGDIYTILIKSRDGKKNEAYGVFYKGKLEEALIAM